MKAVKVPFIPRNPMKKIYEETKKRNTTLHLFNNGTNCRPGTLATGMLEADYYKVFP